MPDHSLGVAGVDGGRQDDQRERVDLEKRSLPPQDQLAYVQRTVQRSIGWRSDATQYGEQDHWARADQTLASKLGDDEDLAILKMQSLKALGFSQRDLYLSMGRDAVRGPGYMVLLVHAGGRFYVLGAHGDADAVALASLVVADDEPRVPLASLPARPAFGRERRAADRREPPIPCESGGREARKAAGRGQPVAVRRGRDRETWCAARRLDTEPRGAFRELEPALSSLRMKGRTYCVLGLRDVRDEPAAVRREWEKASNDAAIRDYYDEVWVYGDAAVFDVVREYGLPADVASRFRYTVFLDQTARLDFQHLSTAATDEPIDLPLIPSFAVARGVHPPRLVAVLHDVVASQALLRVRVRAGSSARRWTLLVPADAVAAEANVFQLPPAPVKPFSQPGAIECDVEVIEFEPGFLDALVNLAKVLEKRDDLPAALKAYERAYALSPGFPKLAATLAKAKRQLGLANQARTLLQSAKTIDPQDLAMGLADCDFELEGENAALARLRASAAR